MTPIDWPSRKGTSMGFRRSLEGELFTGNNAKFPINLVRAKGGSSFPTNPIH